MYIKKLNRNDSLGVLGRSFSGISIETEEELGMHCLAVAEQVTQSSYCFISRISRSGYPNVIAVSERGRKTCTMPYFTPGTKWVKSQ